jgi:hypothetical protein
MQKSRQARCVRVIVACDQSLPGDDGLPLRRLRGAGLPGLAYVLVVFMRWVYLSYLADVSDLIDMSEPSLSGSKSESSSSGGFSFADCEQGLV